MGALGKAIEKSTSDRSSALEEMVVKISEVQLSLANALEKTQALCRKSSEVSSEWILRSQMRRASPSYQRHVATSRVRAVPSQGGDEVRLDPRETRPGSAQTSGPLAKRKKRRIEVGDNDASDG